jgi:hypothetical protein
MRHVNTGLCYLYLEEYTRQNIQPLMHELLYKGLCKTAILVPREEFAKLRLPRPE